MKKANKALVIANGDLKDPGMIKKHIRRYGFDDGSLVISADGGTRNALLLGICPHIVTGDMDSLEQKDRALLESRKARFIIEPPEKDWTDTYLAVIAAIDEGADEILVLAALGSRADHSLANLLMLAAPCLSNVKIKIVTEADEIFAAADSFCLKSEKGGLLSLFSLTPYTLITETRGLKYGLKNEKLMFSPIRGVSNEFTGDEAYIGISKGILLIIKQIKEV